MAEPAGRPGLTPLEGGFSGETFLGSYAGQDAVVRIYGPHSADRGPWAPEVDAAVLRLVRPLLPVPEVLEVHPADPGHDTPGLLLTGLLPGRRLDLLWDGLDRAARRVLGERLGTAIGRLGHVVQPRAGLFADPTLVPEPFPREYADLSDLVGHVRDRLGWPDRELAGLDRLVDEAQALLDTDPRSVLVHADFNPKNLLVDPDTLELTGVLDWEYAHAGSPYADLGNLLRFHRDPAFVRGVLGGYEALMPSVPDDLLDRARAADLVALVDLAVRPDRHAVVRAATDRLRALATAAGTG